MSWSDPCSNCREHRADCECGDWNNYKKNSMVIGSKIKLPLTKSVKDWGGIDSSNAVRIAKEIGQDYLILNEIKDDLYGLWYEEGEEVDYFLKKDLELYD